jgi:hypothetical protein
MGIKVPYIERDVWPMGSPDPRGGAVRGLRIGGKQLMGPRHRDARHCESRPAKNLGAMRNDGPKERPLENQAMGAAWEPVGESESVSESGTA